MSNFRWKSKIGQTLKEGDMSRNIQLFDYRIITPITFLMNFILQEDTQNTPSTKLSTIFLREKDKTTRSKYFKKGVVWNLTMETLIR